jgi:hypothetical protein
MQQAVLPAASAACVLCTVCSANTTHIQASSVQVSHAFCVLTFAVMHASAGCVLPLLEVCKGGCSHRHQPVSLLRYQHRAPHSPFQLQCSSTPNQPLQVVVTPACHWRGCCCSALCAVLLHTDETCL